MAQGSDGAGFAPEAGKEFLLFHQIGAQDLDSHIAVELRVVGFIDLGHAAASERFEDAIFAEGLSFEREGGHFGLVPGSISNYCSHRFHPAQMIPERAEINLSTG